MAFYNTDIESIFKTEIFQLANFCLWVWKINIHIMQAATLYDALIHSDLTPIQWLFLHVIVRTPQTEQHCFSLVSVVSIVYSLAQFCQDLV